MRRITQLLLSVCLTLLSCLSQVSFPNAEELPKAHSSNCEFTSNWFSCSHFVTSWYCLWSGKVCLSTLNYVNSMGLPKLKDWLLQFVFLTHVSLIWGKLFQNKRAYASYILYITAPAASEVICFQLANEIILFTAYGRALSIKPNALMAFCLMKKVILQPTIDFDKRKCWKQNGNESNMKFRQHQCYCSGTL